jgi:hypothetical protein
MVCFRLAEAALLEDCRLRFDWDESPFGSECEKMCPMAASAAGLRLTLLIEDEDGRSRSTMTCFDETRNGNCFGGSRVG